MISQLLQQAPMSTNPNVFAAQQAAQAMQPTLQDPNMAQGMSSMLSPSLAANGAGTTLVAGGAGGASPASTPIGNYTGTPTTPTNSPTLPNMPTAAPSAGATGENVTSNMDPFVKEQINTGLGIGAQLAYKEGGNTRQIQGGSQEGQFSSSGSQSAAQNQASAQTSSQQGSTVGTGSQNTTGTQSTSNNTTNTTSVNDTLGMGQLLKDQQATAAQSDASRSAYLRDVMENGGSAVNSQTQQAVNAALSGPGMQGAGDSAQARAAGYAAAQVARSNQDQRLAAAQQLAGGSAVTSLASAANPYLGSTSTGTGTSDTNTQQASTNQSTQDSSQNSSTAGISSMLSNTKQNSSGSSAASNLGVSFGNSPTQTSSGGSVVCTALYERKMLPYRICQLELQHVRNNWDRFYTPAKGYLSYGVAIAKLVRRSKIAALLALPLAKACSYEAARRVEPWTYPRMALPWVAYNAFYYFNYALGLLVRGKVEVKDPEIAKLLKDNDLSL